MVYNPEHWNVKDPYPDQPLEDINPISDRAWSALIRSKYKDVVKDGFMNLVGAIDIMHGLEYHYNHFCAIVNAIANLPLLDAMSEHNKRFLIHETVAYLNRLGQFYYFSSSSFTKDRVTNWQEIVPTIIKYVRFRHKHSAHRSIDKPMMEDNPHLQKVHAWALSSIGGLLLAPKPGRTSLPDLINNPEKIWNESYICFQLMGDDVNDTINLSIEREHPVFIGEAYDLIFKLLSLG